MLGSTSVTGHRDSRATTQRALSTIDWLIDAVQSLTDELSGRSPGGGSSKPVHKQKKPLRVESLESREMMSVAPLAPPDFYDGHALGFEEYSEDVGNKTSVVIGFDEAIPLGFDASGPAGDAAPTGTSYLLHEEWVGAWCDAEKTPSNTEDDLMCWAGAASNILAWGGWGTDFGLDTADEIFGYFQDHWTDQGGLMEFGWDWFFSGVNDSQGWNNWSQVDVAGGGFYSAVTFLANYHSYSYWGGSGTNAMDDISSLLGDGYGVTLGIYGPGGHAITCWGYNYDGSGDVVGLWITDSDDSKYTNSPPDLLRYYEVDLVGDHWYLQDYYGSDAWYIDYVAGLKSKTPERANSNDISGTVFNDMDSDNLQDAGETGLAGVVVYLDENNNGVLDTVANQRFLYGAAPIAINDSAWTYSTLTVDTAYQSIADLSVELNLTHTYDSDLAVYLTGPNGERIQLFSGIGGSGDNFTDTVLDDDAATSIGAASAPFTGTFRPFESLSTFDGLNANGVWTLSIQDCYGDDVGQLNDWGLNFTFGEAFTTTDASGDYSFENLDNGTYKVRAVGPVDWMASAGAGGVTAVLNNGTHATTNFGFYEGPPDVNTVTPVELGAVAYGKWNNRAISGGQTWYHAAASRDGHFSVRVTSDGAPLLVQFYDSDSVLLDAMEIEANDTGTLDFSASALDDFYIRVIGSGTCDINIANLLSVTGSSAAIAGTNGNDVFRFAAGQDAVNHVVTINGFEYSFATGDVNEFLFDGGAGTDVVDLVGNDAHTEVFTLLPNEATAGAVGGYEITVLDAEQINAFGGAEDVAYLFDSAGDDTVVATPERMTMTGPGFVNSASGFGEAAAVSTGRGFDVAQLYDSAGDDTFYGDTNEGSLSGNGFQNRVRGFDRVRAYATSGGTDTAELHGSTGNDQYRARHYMSTVWGEDFFNQVLYFDEVHAFAEGGYDIAYYHGTSGTDYFSGDPVNTRLHGSGYDNSGEGFDRAFAYGGGGNDYASLFGSAGNDQFRARHYMSTVWGEGFFNQVRDFDEVRAFAEGGYDVAYFHGTSGTDYFSGDPVNTRLHGSGYDNSGEGFDRAYAYGGRGTDYATLHDSAGDDQFRARHYMSTLWGEGFFNQVRDFYEVRAFAESGNDTAYFHGTSGTDRFYGRPMISRLYGPGYDNSGEGFDQAYAYGSRGKDYARLYDSAGDDVMGIWRYEAYMQGEGFYVHAEQFEDIYGYANKGGNDEITIYGTSGNDTLGSYLDRKFTYIKGSDYINRTSGFERVTSYGSGGKDYCKVVGTSDIDSLYARSNWAEISNSDSYIYLDNFERMYADLAGARDSVDKTSTSYFLSIKNQ